MYEFIRGLHNLLRWVVLFGGVAAVASALRGLASSGRWSAGDARAGAIFRYALLAQFAVGLLLYVASPIVRGGLAEFGAAMRDEGTRFFLVEHGVIMLLAIAAVEIGTARIRRATDDHRRFVTAAIAYSVSMALILYAIPWWRPLLPWG